MLHGRHSITGNVLGIAEGRNLMHFRSANVQKLIEVHKLSFARQPAFWQYLVVRSFFFNLS